MEFHMINITYAALYMRAQTEKTTFSCKDDCTLTKHTRRWTYSALRYFFLLDHNRQTWVYRLVWGPMEVCSGEIAIFWQRMIIRPPGITRVNGVSLLVNISHTFPYNWLQCYSDCCCYIPIIQSYLFLLGSLGTRETKTLTDNNRILWVVTSLVQSFSEVAILSWIILEVILK